MPARVNAGDLNGGDGLGSNVVTRFSSHRTVNHLIHMDMEKF